MKFFNVKTTQEVLKILDEISQNKILQKERVSLLESVSRTSASKIISTVDVPAFNRSTVDGYAVKCQNTHGASDSIPVMATLIGKVDMGKETNLTVGNDEVVYVPTGGMLPNGADSMIMIEDTVVLDERFIGLMKPVGEGNRIIKKGDDLKTGDIVISKSQLITSMDVGVLASLGIAEVEVMEKPKVTIISTGDEIIDLGEEQTLGSIYDINSYVLTDLVHKSGGQVLYRKIVKDNESELSLAVLRAASESDIVLISGGSSVGTRDFTHQVITGLPESKIHVEGVGIKPGKPTIIGTSRDTIVFGLPGHPVSSIMIYKVFVDYYIRRILGTKNKNYDFSGVLTENVHAAPGKTTYQMVSLSYEGDEVLITPNHGKSGMITLLSNSVGYIVIDAHKEGLDKGTRVKGYKL